MSTLTSCLGQDALKHFALGEMRESDGLSAAHAQGLLHRDVKPANIWLEARADGRGGAGLASHRFSLAPRVELLDFGLAWIADDSGPLTDCGTVVGTPPYMAPEQARSETADVRSDLFSLGSVLYAMCAGEAPLQVDKKTHLIAKIVGTETSRVCGVSVDGKSTDEQEAAAILAERILPKLTK